MSEESRPHLTVRGVVKHVASSAVGMGTSVFTAKTVDNYTRFEKEDFIVKLGAGAVGFIVATKVTPYTDMAVDKTADFITAKYEARKTKKTEKIAK